MSYFGESATSLPLPASIGGTGLSSLTGNQIIISTTTGFAELGAATNGQIPIGRTGNSPVLAAITAGAGVSVTNGSGSITLAWDPSTFVNNITLWNGANSSRTLTAGLSGASDPVLTFSNADVAVNCNVTAPTIVIGVSEATIIGTKQFSVFHATGPAIVLRETTNDIEGFFQCFNGAGFSLGTTTNHNVQIYVANSLRWYFSGSSLLLNTNNVSDIGTSATKLRSVYVGTGVTSLDVFLTASSLTAGTLTETTTRAVRRVWHRFDWTNAMIAALGASPTGDITVCTLPAKTRVVSALIVVGTPGTFADTLTASLGRTGAGYNDYVLAGDIKAAANTVYGDAVGEMGANLYDGTTILRDLPSWTGTTEIKLHIDGNATDLSGVTTSTGSVYLETETLP